jgi:hypothetical protein
MALAAIANNGNIFALDQIHVRVAVIVNAHISVPCSASVLMYR